MILVSNEGDRRLEIWRYLPDQLFSRPVPLPNSYRRNQVREYLAWITSGQRLLWWELREGEYQEIPVAADKLLKSSVFPGLWLDDPALLRLDMKAVLAALRRGLDCAGNT